MKISYGISNLRSFEDMQPIELCPITLLVGANSSGKSTFLRSISLLGQSLSENTDEPILWYKKDLLDFGDFSTAVKDRESDKEISFKFKFHELPFQVTDTFRDYSFLPTKEVGGLSYRVGVMKEEENIIISSIEIAIEDLNIYFFIKYKNEEYKYFLNNQEIKINKYGKFFIDRSKMFYNINFTCSSKNVPSEIQYFIRKYNARMPYTEFMKNICGVINAMIDVDSITNFHDFFIELEKIVLSYPLEDSHLIKLRDTTEIPAMKEVYSTLINHKDSDILRDLRINSALYMVIYFLNDINSYLKHFFLNATRMGPARGLNDRFFRVQRVDVSDISNDGQNLPMFLLKLKENNLLTMFSNWANEMIGYEFDVAGDFPNIEIRVNKNGVSENLIDTGYGVSQILPILAQIWLSTFRNDPKVENIFRNVREFDSIVLMEEPELHLHPYYQAQLAKALASSIIESRKNFVFPNPLYLVETHSEDLINRMGTLIRDGYLSEDDVQVVIFSRGKNNANSTSIEIATYNDDGTLNNWPYGFFNYRHAY